MASAIETVGPAPLDARATQHMVPMRDGTHLATDVYLPDGPGPFPTVLVRLPYDKSGTYCFMPLLAGRVISRGYAFVPQDVRGKFRSEGEPVAFVNEAADGRDTIDWIVQQSWSNGHIGMWGDSYYGFTQWAAAIGGHPALKAIVPRLTSMDLPAWLDGVTPLYGAHYLASVWGDKHINGWDWEPDWSHRPLSEVFDPVFSAIGRRSRSFDDLLARSREGSRRSPLLSSRSFEHLRVPTLHGIGWFDNILRWHMRDYEALVANPATAPFQYLHAGSTDHENYTYESVPVAPEEDHAVSDDALKAMLDRYIGPALDFFDAFLAGRVDPASVPRVRWHLPFSGWQETPCWPPPGATELRLYLTGAAGAVESPPGGSLATAAPSTAETVTWLHDPEDLVPSTIVNPFALLLEYPDERQIESRADVMVFTGPVIDEPITLAGPVVARLAVTSSAPSLFIHAKLVDVHPNGRAHAILFGQELVERPRSDQLAEVELGHTGYTLRSGHRLRLQVASSDFPLFLPHPGTEENPWDATATRKAEQSLGTGGGTASHVSLTVLASQ